MKAVPETWLDVLDPENPSRYLAQVRCRPDGLTIRPAEKGAALLVALDLIPVHERMGKTKGRGVQTFVVPRPLLGKVLEVFPPEVRGLVEAEYPHWISWLEAEQARHDQMHRHLDALSDLSGALTAPRSLWLTGAKNLTQTLPPGAPYRKLRAYQRVGLYWLILCGGRGILGDDMGLGKTAQSLSYCQITSEAKRVLVVCPSSVTDNWVIEGKTWAPRLTLRTVSSTRECATLATEGLAEGEGWVMTWGLFARCRGILVQLGFDTVIADEAHNAKEGTAQRTRALIEIMHDAERRILLTGTEVRSRPQELWTLLHIIDPLAFPCFRRFGERFCAPSNKHIAHRTIRTYTGASRLTELNRLMRPYVQRRTKVDACPELPPKARSKLIIHAGRKFYYDHSLLIEAINQEKEKADGGNALALMSEIRKHVGLAKVAPALDWIVQTYAQGEPCIVFLHHNDVHAELRSGLERMKGLRYEAIVGSTPKMKRQEIKERFQAGEIDVLVGSEAMKEGVTLHRCAYVLHLERWWTPGDEDQGDDRAYRIGQARPVFCTTLHIAGSFDDYVDALLENKRAIVDQIQSRTSIQRELLSTLRRGKT